jgi:salicylate hydroxylase
LLGEDHEATNPTFTGKYAYRGLIQMEKAVEAIGDELARNSQMYLGRHGHILTFPIEKGKTMNVVAFQTKMDGKWQNENWVLPMKKEDMFNDFAGWGETVHQILSVS